MKKNILIALPVLVVLGVGFWVFKSSNLSGAISALPTPVPVDQMKTYSLADISSHNSQNDCWMAIDGGVYDVTAYVKLHRGVDKILRGCGKAATSLFHNRPDREPDHSPAAVAILNRLKVGILGS